MRPLRRLWESVTPWGVHLAWWLGCFEPGSRPVPNPDEVADISWLTPQEMSALAELLESNREFIEAWRAGRIPLEL